MNLLHSPLTSAVVSVGKQRGCRQIGVNVAPAVTAVAAGVPDIERVGQAVSPLDDLARPHLGHAGTVTPPCILAPLGL